MRTMNFTNWERSDYYGLYDQLVQALDPEYEMPPNALMGDLSQGWSKSFQAIRLKSSNSNQEVVPAEDSISEADRQFMMRYMQLKYSILFLQQYRYLGKYCFYGCWCLPGGVGDIGVGHGQPVDNIDRSCREYATCYQCMYNQQMGGQCDQDDEGSYTIQGAHRENGKVFLMCTDPVGSCRRQRCECDKHLAEKLAKHEPEWNLSHHRRWGDKPFDYNNQCNAQATTANFRAPTWSTRGTTTTSTTTSQTLSNEQIYSNQMPLSARSARFFSSDRLAQTSESYGDSVVFESAFTPAEGGITSLPERSSYPAIVSSIPLYGRIIGCCGRSPHVHYFRQGQKCCPDGTIVAAQSYC